MWRINDTLRGFNVYYIGSVLVRIYYTIMFTQCI